jgi:hypothetical protein
MSLILAWHYDSNSQQASRLSCPDIVRIYSSFTVKPEEAALKLEINCSLDKNKVRDKLGISMIQCDLKRKAYIQQVAHRPEVVEQGR